jgi:anti-sigma B factor antagonist
MSLEVSLNTEKAGSNRFMLKGSLNSDTAPDLDTAIKAAPDAKIVIFDMLELDFISSAGLRVIFATLKKQKASGGKVAVSNMKPGVKKVFEIVKALPDLTVFASVKEMDDYLARFQETE